MAKTEVRLAREMTLLQVTMIGVGAMIGAGIFVLTGIAAGVAGPALLVVFLLNGIMTTLTALAYAELGSSFHDAGGGYLWVKTGLPDPNGFLSGWISWFAHAVACSLYALGFGAYFNEFLRAINLPLPFFTQGGEKVLAVLIILIFTYINFRGASETGKAGVFVSLAKVVVVGFFIVIGLIATFKNPRWMNHFSNFFPKGWAGVFTAMGLTFIAFEGYEIIAQCSEEVVNPKKNIPKAIFLSLIIVIPIYLLVAFVALGGVEVSGMPTWQYLGIEKELALVQIATKMLPIGGAIILFGGLLSTMSALNATIYSSTRVSFAMGRDHNLPDLFGRIHKTFKTPAYALGFSSLLIIFMALVLPIEDVASAADVMFLLLFIQVNLALMALRKKIPHLDRGFKVPWVPLIPILAIITQGGIALYLAFYSPSAWITILIWLGSGWFIHKNYASKKEEAAEAMEKRLEKLERMEYRLLCAISHPKTYPQIMKAAIPIAKYFKGEIICVTVAEVPDGYPLLKGLDQVDTLEPVLEEAAELSQNQDIPTRQVIKFSHRISQGIVGTALEEDCNFILVGRGRNLTFIEKIFASVIDHIIHKAPVEVGVVVGEIPNAVKTILLPYTDQPHTRLTKKLLPAFCSYYQASVKVVQVVDPYVSKDKITAVQKNLEDTFQDASFPVSLEVIPSPSVVRGLIHAAKGCQLILMGGDETTFWEQLIAPPIPYQLADRTRKPMIIIRKFGEVNHA